MILKIKEIFGEPIQTELSGAEIIDRIGRGHLVRRSSWVEGIYIHVCNYDDKDIKDGYIPFDQYKSYYMIGTDGYFLHLGSSSQPYTPEVVTHNIYGPEIQSRVGEGITCFFANDWEDYGYMKRDDFDSIRMEYKEKVRQHIREINERAIAEYKRERTHNEI